jgi:glutathione S-transferase
MSRQPVSSLVEIAEVTGSQSSRLARPHPGESSCRRAGLPGANTQSAGCDPGFRRERSICKFGCGIRARGIDTDYGNHGDAWARDAVAQPRAQRMLASLRILARHKQIGHAMPLPLLVIGNKNYSSWSLRPWLLLRQFELGFQERRLPLDTPEFATEVAQLSPSRKVPVLHHDDLVVWDSLAICEYINDTWLDGRGWPHERRARALARAAAAEMHSGFPALRAQLPMNCERRPDGYRWDAAAQGDIDRVIALWNDLRTRFAGDGPFLCGGFGIVDAMYAPVVIRFRGYGVQPEGTAGEYMASMLALPAMREWIDAGVAEAERLAKYEQLKAG